MDEQLSPCQLCDGEEDAIYECGGCGQFCDHCHRVHSKCCFSPVTSLQNSASSRAGRRERKGPKWRRQGEVEMIDTATRVLQDNLKQVHHQHQAVEVQAQFSRAGRSGQGEVEMIDAATGMLQDSLMEVHHQHQAAEAQMQADFAEGIRRLTKARDEYFTFLEKVSKMAESSVQSDINMAQKAMKEIGQEASVVCWSILTSVVTASWLKEQEVDRMTDDGKKSEDDAKTGNSG